MHPKQKPLYIGVTDFTDENQSRMMLDLVPLHHRYQLMVGTMMSYKVLNGVPSKWQNAKSWCKPLDLHRPFVRHPKAFNTLHWADYEGLTQSTDLVTAITHSGPHLHAIQLDMVWPRPELIKAVISHHRVSVVLQVGRAAIATAGNLDGVAHRLDGYENIIDYILLDMSGGEGRLLNVETTLAQLRFLTVRFPRFKFAVAGGLGPDTLSLLAPILAEFPDISIDAQSKLRLSGDAQDPLEQSLVERYIERVFVLLK